MKINVELKTLDELILTELKKQGFPMGTLGTYFYKDIVKKIVICLKKTSADEDIVKLRRDVLSPYSQFYFEVAKNDNDMDIKEFHSEVSGVSMQASNNINIKFNYMELAFALGYLIFTTLDNKVLIKECGINKNFSKVSCKKRVMIRK